MTERLDTIVIGGGQAGLSMSYLLKQEGREHVILDRGRPGDSWRQRWDSFCLVTKNWMCQLPGFPYDGDDPEGFMSREDIINYIERYAASFEPPLCSGVEVLKVRAGNNDSMRFVVETSQGSLESNHVIVAVGTFHHPRIPEFAANVADDITALHTRDYKNPEALPEGAVLVVGSGQSGVQVAEDLFLAGRTVHLATGSSGRLPRRYRGRDMNDWVVASGLAAMPAQQHPAWPAQRFAPNPILTGRERDRSLDLRKFGRDGILLYGRLTDLSEHQASFADNLHANLEKADAGYRQFASMVDGYIEKAGLDAPPPDLQFTEWQPKDTPTTLDLTAEGITSIVWATGYRYNFDWIDIPVFDEKGYPRYQRGITEVPGLYFLGLHWLHTVGSGLFYAVGKDAQFLLDDINSLS